MSEEEKQVSQFQKYIDLIEECTKQDENYIASSTGFIRGMLTDLKNEYRKLEQQKTDARKILILSKVDIHSHDHLAVEGPAHNSLSELMKDNIIKYSDYKALERLGEVLGFNVIVNEE